VNMVGLDVARLGGDLGDGESGDFGDKLGDFLTKLNLEGDRESERRRDLTAEVTSTWWTCVGEGSVRVPPPPFEYDMIYVVWNEVTPVYDTGSETKIEAASWWSSLFRDEIAIIWQSA
jgi:hypothetical protein